MIDFFKKRLHYYKFFRETKSLRKNFPFYSVMSIQETIEDLILNRKNISRFGDGEFRLMLDDSGIGFQKGSFKMTEKLREVILSDFPNHLVAIPETFRKTNKLNWRVKYWWLNFINNVGIKITDYLKPEKIYANAFITRFYLDYETKKHLPETVKNLKKIWQNQDVLIVEGRFSRLGVANDLFDNVKSLQRILCPEKNAFDKYEEIFEATKNFGKDKLILLALGPTATIMAYDLAKENFWALDIGHIDLEYMWYLMNAKEKMPVIGRLVNETKDQLSLEIPEEYRESYEKSIIKTVQ